MHAFKSGNLPILVATDVACKKERENDQTSVPSKQNPTHTNQRQQTQNNELFFLLFTE
jgi:hypothetical protein